MSIYDEADGRRREKERERDGEPTEGGGLTGVLIGAMDAVGERMGGDKPAPAPADGGGAQDDGGGYAPAETGATYTGDIAMMTAEADHTEQTVLAHYELLISQAEKAGNGPQTLQALRAGLEAARTAAGSARDAITAVQGTNEGVQTAYDATAGEAAKDKSYFHGD